MPTLTWTGKEDALRAASLVPFRLLEPHTAVRGGIIGDPKAAQDNLLIQGDNLEALKALLPYYAGRVKCIYIDPPYNTGSAFEHYDDNLEHSIWLSMMYPRLELLRELLAEEGSIWVNLDDNEGHYSRVILDEIFGRSNFIADVIWEKADSPRMDAEFFSSRHDHILCYAKNIRSFAVVKRNHIEELPDHYDRRDEQGKPYYLKPLRAMGPADRREDRPTMFFEMVAPDNTSVFPKKPNGSDGRWRWGRDRVLDDASLIEWVNGRNGWIPYYRVYAETSMRTPPETIWFNDEVGSNRTAKAESKTLFGEGSAFATPKPEGLLQRIIEVSTQSGDLVLDSFLGSGTTAAVAHKMGRRWIGIEMGDHAVTHCLPRLQKVIDGEQGGISEAVSWKGGGGFRFVKLGETVFQPDGSLNPKVSFKSLAAHIWWRETGNPLADTPKTPLIGTHEGKAFYLLYNGILGDKRPEAGNVLTPTVLSKLPTSEGQKVIFAEACLIPARNLERLGIIFRQVPYDLGGLHA